MGFQQFGPYLSAPAAADLSTKQWRFVKLDNTGAIALCTVAGEKPVGVLIDDPKQAQNGSYQVYGVTKIVAGAAVAAGAQVTTDANAAVITAGIGNFVFGTALEAAGAAGEIIAVLIEKAGNHA